jgi:hypothetical protein
MVGTNRVLLILTSVALVWGGACDWRSRMIPRIAGLGVLALGLAFLMIGRQWLESAFYLAAVWGSRGSVWRLPVFILAILLVGRGGIGSVPLALGILCTLSIFWLGWLGGGDAQLAIGLMAFGGDWWMLGYLFGGTILLGLGLMVAERGMLGAGRRIAKIFRHLESPDEEALRVPWGVLAAASGLVYIWIWPALFRGLGG